MQSISAAYERLQTAFDKAYEWKLVIDDVGEFGKDKLVSVSTNITMFSGTPQIGMAVAAEIDVSLLVPSASIPRMACLRPYIRANGTAAKSTAVTITEETLSSTYASYSSETITFAAGASATVTNESIAFPVDSTESLTSEWLPQGVFFIDTRQITANYNGIPVLTIHGYDAMMKAEQEYSSNSVINTAPDTQYVQAIADAIGVTVDPRTWEIMRGYEIPFPLGYTMREILGYIASSYVGCFIITDEGKLRLVSLLGLPAEQRDDLLGDENGNAILFGGVAILV